jgi:heme-degrading monooxygenase HmoA
MTQAVEVVNCRPKIDVEASEFEAAASAITNALSGMEGFVARDFGRDSNGHYIDVVRWKDLQCAQKAADEAMKHPECQAFFKLIDEETVKMTHYETV